MPPKGTKGKKAQRQPKIRGFTQSLRRGRSCPLSEPQCNMLDIQEEGAFEIEQLPEDAGIKELVLKMNEVCGKEERIEKFLFEEETGMQNRMPVVELKAETNAGKALVMSKEFKAIKQDINTIKGTVHRQFRQIDAIDSKVIDLTARSMAQNFVISGVIEDRNENCQEKVKRVLHEEMGIDLSDMLKVKIAHRIGIRRLNVDRAMVVKVNLALKEKMLKNVDSLEGRRNAKGNSFYINVQQPEAKVEARRNAKALLKKFQKLHKDAEVEIKGDKVYVNKEWQRPLVRAPTPKDTFYDAAEQKEMNRLRIIYTPPQDTGFCTFWGAAIRVTLTLEVQRAYNKIRQEHSDLDHIALAYVAPHNGTMTSGLVDDKEYGAGFRILRQIQEKNEKNIAVFIARKFGGLHLGTARFNSIEKAAIRALEQIIEQVQTPQSQKITEDNQPCPSL